MQASTNPSSGCVRHGIARALGAAIIGIFALSCGSGHAILQISAPATVVAGTPFIASVTAMYHDRPDTMIPDPLHHDDQAALLRTL